MRFFAASAALQRPGRRLLWLSLGRNFLCHRRVNASNKSIIMGDRSPKSNQKKSTQKQFKANNADQLKKQAVFAKQSASKKK
jgi:hypothetical protein